MTLPALEAVVIEATKRMCDHSEPADCVLALAPLMLDLIQEGKHVS